MKNIFHSALCRFVFIALMCVSTSTVLAVDTTPTSGTSSTNTTGTAATPATSAPAEAPPAPFNAFLYYLNNAKGTTGITPGAAPGESPSLTPGSITPENPSTTPGPSGVQAFVDALAIAMGKANAAIPGAGGSSEIVKAIEKMRKELKKTIKTEINEVTQRLDTAFTGQDTDLNAASRTAPLSLVTSGARDLADKYIKAQVPPKVDASMPKDKEAEAEKEGVMGVLAAAGPAYANTQLLLGPLTYTDEEFKNVDTTLSLFSGYLSPSGTLSLSAIKDKYGETNKDVQKYQLKLYNLAAIRSLVLDNLYQSVAARMPVKGLGTQAALGKPDASLAEVSHYISTRRANSQAWYNKIDNATPIQIQRETLYTLADIQASLSQLHSDNERIIQTLTAMTILNLQAMSLAASPEEIKMKQEMEGPQAPGLKGSQGSGKIDANNAITPPAEFKTESGSSSSSPK